MRAVAGGILVAVVVLGTAGLVAGGAAAAPGQFPAAGNYGPFGSKDTCQSNHDDAIRDYNSAKQRQRAEDDETRRRGQLPPHRGMGGLSISECTGSGSAWTYSVSYPS